MALFGNLDGAKGCVLPVRVVEIAKGLKWWGLAVWVAVWVRVIWCRVVDEEDMLKKEFGREWVSWNGRTARFIPWVI